MPHLVATLIYLSQNYSYHIRGERSPLNEFTIARYNSLNVKSLFKIYKPLAQDVDPDASLMLVHCLRHRCNMEPEMNQYRGFAAQQIWQTRGFCG